MKKITVKQLDDLYRKVIHKIYIYQHNCAICGRPEKSEYFQIGHLVSRRNMSTRWDTNNSGLICEYCNNNFDKTKEKALAVHLDIIWGSGTSLNVVKKAQQDFRCDQVFMKTKLNELKNLLK